MAGPYLTHQQGSNATTVVVAGDTNNVNTAVKGTNQVVYFRGIYLEANSADGTVQIQSKNSSGTFTSEATFKVNSGQSDSFYADSGIRLKRGMRVVSDSGITNCVITYTA
tara:strand:+ start:6464 stop:6793 length:330 start_codon:yes stop_codon:yes gene_type:complete